MKRQKKLIISEENVSIEDVYNIAFNDGRIELSQDRPFIEKINKSRQVLERELAAGATIYGVTTGYGDSCNVEIPKDFWSQLPICLTRYHQCGTGQFFSVNEARAIQLCRIISLSKGHSAIRLSTLEFMVECFNQGITPKIPQEGSVGASGDLTPLAYYASSLIGEAAVYYQGQEYLAKDLYHNLNIKPLILAPKEALALMNGTAVMTALACIVFKQSEYTAKLSARLTSMASLSLLANSQHFDDVIFEAKPHKGTIDAAKIIRKDLSKAYNQKALTRLQDRYSIRCAPHIIGALGDALIAFEDIIEIELNSANDNPLVNIENEKIVHGGNFYGGHIAFTMDALKIQIANIADLVDRQIALLVDVKFNNGLPANLIDTTTDNPFLNHGLKAVQIGASASTAECLKNSMPASIFSRSTECHNQDKVSMGTIAARDALRSVELLSQVCAACVIATTQAIDIRVNNNEISLEVLSTGIKQMITKTREFSSFITNDRPLDKELKNISLYIQELGSEFIQ